MKKLIFLAAVVALAIPTSVAFAKSPHANQTRGKSNPMVMYVLKGTLSDFTAATSGSDGTISITVNHSNRHGRVLKGQTIPFSVAQNTRITFRNGTTTIAPDAKGMLKFRAPLMRKGDTTLAATLTTNAKALHIIVQSH
ncbi:MAG TPA: hypothetical protein VFU64_03710 [Gaiellaceae bacterium]|nr:hypothetical protein [Gaiellaceae bacterium]